MLPESTQTGHEALYGAAATFLVVIAQAIRAEIKGRRGKRENAGQTAHLNRIENTLTDFTAEQRATNELLATQITAVDHIVRGVDGENGIRGDTRKLKGDMETLRERGYFTTPPERPRIDPRDVGTYQAPRSA